MGAEITLVNALKIVGGDGTVQWVNANQLGVVYRGVAKVAIVQGQALAIDPTDTIIPRQDYLSTETPPAEVLSLRLLDNTATNGSPFGVALSAAAIGATVIAAGPGAVVAVKSSGAGAVGNYVNGSATPGTVTPAATALAAICLGLQVKASISGGTGTQVGILVMPGFDT